MSNHLFQQFEAKIDQALETIESLRIQVEEWEQRYTDSEADNLVLKNRQTQWENNLSILLRKLEGAALAESLERDRYREDTENHEASLERRNGYIILR